MTNNPPAWSQFLHHLPENTREDARILKGDFAEQEADFCIKTFENAEALRGAVHFLPKTEPTDLETRHWEEYVNAVHRHVVGRYLLQQGAKYRTLLFSDLDYAFAALRKGALDAYVAVRQVYHLRKPAEPVVEPTDEEWARLQEQP